MLNRRTFLKKGLLGAAGVAVLRNSGGTSMTGTGNTPNVLILHTDQESAWTVGAYGGTLVGTPHIDELAAEGATLTQFFTNSAVCTPSRGCLITGRYPHANGAYKNNIELNRDEVTLAHALKANGYETGYAGKWHLDGPPKPGWVDAERSMGFEDSTYMYNRGHWKSILEQPTGDPEVSTDIGDATTYTTDWLATKTIEFIQRPRTKPFFFMLSIPDPHTPFSVRPSYNTMYDPASMPIPSTFHQTDVPDWAEKAQEDMTESQLRAQKAQYCGEMKCIDDNVGRIVQCLKTMGIYDNTIVIHTTDHGEYMGEHGLMHKNKLYETAYRIPMIIRWQGAIDSGTVIERIVDTVDFKPTILGLLGIAPTGNEHGRDASPLLRGETIDWDDVSYIHHSTFTRAGIFTPEFELAYVKDYEPILFDRINDPDQVHNLFNDPAYASVVEELTGRIIQHNLEVGAPAAEWLVKLSTSTQTSKAWGRYS